MSPNIRLFAISSDRWHGLETHVDISNKNSINEIVEEVKLNLFNTLTRANFVNQLHELQHKNKKFHIHDITMEDIKTSPSNKVFYVCDHCN